MYTFVCTPSNQRATITPITTSNGEHMTFEVWLTSHFDHIKGNVDHPVVDRFFKSKSRRNPVHSLAGHIFATWEKTRPRPTYICSLDDNRISFRDGQLVFGTSITFVTTFDALSRNYFDVTYRNLPPCALLDDLLTYQRYSSAQIDVIKIVLGHAIAGVKDTWRSFILLHGITSTGKSLLSNWLYDCFPPELVYCCDETTNDFLGVYLKDCRLILGQDKVT